MGESTLSLRAVGALRRVYHRLLLPIPVLGPLLRRLVGRFFVWLFARDLRRLHDVLADTDLAGHYWVTFGLLVGWAREGRLLQHDLGDADFGVRLEHVPLLEAAVPALRQAGFRPYAPELANDGRVTDMDFYRSRRWPFARFDFKIFDRVDGQLRYFNHSWNPDRPVEVDCRIPEQELIPVQFVGRTWLRSADADLELTAIYGDWRRPRPDWDSLRDERSAFCCQVWTNVPWSA